MFNKLEPLEKIHIKLSCNHVFNYESIFNEVVKQKLKKNYKETQSYHAMK